MQWCKKCGGYVSKTHRHWGVADFRFDRATEQWFCRWCKQQIADNEADCKCKFWPK